MNRLNILAAGDIHGIPRLYRGVARLALGGDVDVLVLAGDLTSYGERAYEREMRDLMRNVGIPVLFIMGNDDDRQWPDSGGLVNIDRKRVEIQNVPFVGYQYTNPFVGGAFEKNDRTQEADFAGMAALVDDRTVLVTHGPPLGVLDRTIYGEHVGSAPLGNFVARRSPRFHIFGHIHENCGAVGRSFNVSCAVSGMAMKLEYYSGVHEFIAITKG